MGVVSANIALQEAIECYENLDYPCAESKLVQALEQPGTKAERITALYYQALIASAWRDEERIKRVVRNIYSVHPTYVPKDAPPDLVDVFDALRPEPVEAPVWGARLGYRHSMLVDREHDAGWWSDGLGVGAGAFVRLRGRYLLEVDLHWTQHQPQPERFSVKQLDLFGLAGGGGAAFKLGRFWFTGGLLAGAVRVNRTVQDSYESLKESSSQTPFWTTSAALYLDVSIELVYGLSLGARWSPTAIIRIYDDQPTVSYLLPVTAGVRYGR